MPLSEKCEALIQAELKYAHFNAVRTSNPSSVEGDIELTSFGRIPGLLDKTRPGVAYYNRAFIPPRIVEIGPVLERIPPEVTGIELLMHQQTKANADALLAGGFVPGDSLCYLVGEPAERVAVEYDVRQLDPSERDLFFDLLELSGADFPEEKREAKRHFYCNDTFRCYVAFASDGEPGAWATMYVGDESAFFANAYTLPDFRCQGLQTSLLHARLNDVMDADLGPAFTDVVPASPSHRNCERCGFRILLNNSIWVRADLKP